MIDLHVDSAYFRLGLRVYFIAAILLVALIGDACCLLRTRLRLLKGQETHITEMTGWIRGFGSLWTSVRLRRLPGGWFGGIMVFTALLAIGADFGTAFVGWVLLPSKCDFGMGVVLDPNKAHFYPSYYGAAYTLVDKAQSISIGNSEYNDCYFGIYSKADNSTNFCAGVEDILGFWECDKSSPPISYENYLDEDIWLDLYKQDLLYFDGGYTNISDLTKPKVGDLAIDGGSAQTFIITANTTQRGETFNIRVAVDLEDTNRVLNAKTMQPYVCYVRWLERNNGADAILRIMKAIDIRRTVRWWVSGFQGALYDGQDQLQVSDDYSNFTIAVMLNNMFMVSGGFESIKSPAPGEKQGCLVYGTSVPNGVVALIAIVGLLAISLVVYMLVLWFAVWRERKRYDAANPGSAISAKDICNSAPNGLLDWMSHSAYASNHHINKNPKHRRLSGWHFSTKHHGGRRVGVVEAGQSTTPSLSSTPFVLGSPASSVRTPSTGEYSPYQPGYFNQKTGYAVVHTQEMPRY